MYLQKARRAKFPWGQKEGAKNAQKEQNWEGIKERSWICRSISRKGLHIHQYARKDRGTVAVQNLLILKDWLQVTRLFFFFLGCKHSTVRVYKIGLSKPLTVTDCNTTRCEQHWCFCWVETINMKQTNKNQNNNNPVEENKISQSLNCNDNAMK